MSVCCACGEEIDKGSVFCPYCGKRVSRLMVCGSCGRELRHGARFCDFCGKSVEESSTALSDQRSAIARLLAKISAKKAGKNQSPRQDLSPLPPYNANMSKEKTAKNEKDAAVNQNEGIGTVSSSEDDETKRILSEKTVTIKK